MKLGLTQSFLKSECVTEDLAEDVSIWAAKPEAFAPSGTGQAFQRKV